jgi:hypothetical protein
MAGQSAVRVGESVHVRPAAGQFHLFMPDGHRIEESRA